MGTNQPPRGFPRDLLDGNADDRRAYFWRYAAAHRIQLDADHAVTRALLRARSTRTVRAQTPLGTVVLLFGPTGVGKTTIFYTIARRLLARDVPRLAHDKTSIPFCYIAALAPDRNLFRWPDLYREILGLLNRPYIDQLERSGSRSVARPILPDDLPQGPDAALRGAFERALRDRNVEELWLDEAGHLAKTSGGKALGNQIELVKSLSDRTATTFVLMGAYDSLVFRALSPQLGRRCVEIHVPRYRLELAEDVREFKRVLRTFQKQLPLAQEPDLLSHWDLCYDGSVGCIGVLKEWLYRALDAALGEAEAASASAKEQKTVTITPALLEQEMLAPDLLVQMAAAALDGEAEMAEAYGVAQRNALTRMLRRNVGLPAQESSPGTGSPTPMTQMTAEPAESGTPPPSGQRRRPGERTPTRDHAGTSEAG